MLSEEKVVIVDSVIQSMLDEYEDTLKYKKAKKNNRNKEGLLNAIYMGYEDFLQKHTLQELEDMPLNEFEKKLKNTVWKSAHFYINEPLIYSVAKRFSNTSLTEEDRVEIASEGFVRALNEYDPERGAKFSTYSWRVMSNEIISVIDKSKKTSVVEKKDRNIYAHKDGVITNIELSPNPRKFNRNGKIVNPYDISVKTDNGSVHIYHYIYSLEPYIKLGNYIEKGQQIGKTAGVLEKIGSMDSLVDSEDFGDIKFSNPISNVGDFTPEDEMIQNNYLDMLREAMDEVLTEEESTVLTKRFLHPSNKKVNRRLVAAELGETDYKIAKMEKIAMDKIKRHLINNGITKSDVLSAFEHK